MSTRIIKFGRVSVSPSGPYWRVRWRENNMPQERSRKTEELACQLARETEARLSSGQVGSPEGSFGALCTAAMHRSNFPRYSDDAYNNLRSLLRIRIMPTFAHQRARSVQQRDLQDLLDRLLYEDGLSKHTVSKVRSILVRVGNYGVREGIWTPGQNPANDIAVPASAPGDENDVQLGLIPDDEIPSSDQVDKLLAAAWAESPRNGFILEMAAKSGLRWSEIMGLKPEDFDLDARTVYVRRVRRVRHDGTVVVKPPKTKAGRRKTVVATESVDKVAGFVAGKPTGEFLVQTRNGTILQRPTFTPVLKRLRAATGYPQHMSVHSLRHFFGSRACRMGVTAQDVSKMLGHANVNVTTTLYLHGDESSVERAKDLL
jgi:integrase